MPLLISYHFLMSFSLREQNGTKRKTLQIQGRFLQAKQWCAIFKLIMSDQDFGHSQPY
jgi:hypothetical protein